LLVAVTVGPAAPLVGRGVAWVAEGMWWLIVTPLSALWHLLPTSHTQPPISAARNGLHPVPVVAPATHTTSTTQIPSVIGYVFFAVALVVVAVLIIRYLRPLGRGGRGPADVAEGEERDSVFSWRHLADQLRHALTTLFTRRHRRSTRPAVVAVPDTSGRDPEAESVRQAYRRMLKAARSSGQGRAANETPLELQRRLGAGPAAGAADALAELTDLYDGVRYGEHESAERDLGRAVAHASAVSTALKTPKSPE
jgi:hypothetical protein